MSDLLYRSVAIVTTSNVVTEAYDTDAYGNTLCYSGPGTDGLWFTDDDVQTDNPINTHHLHGKALRYRNRLTRDFRSIITVPDTTRPQMRTVPQSSEPPPVLRL